mmetsp:Transcript_5639/g.16318  ORF Transcript_5639/g.16318 Transcript_5639/m.16318 type:complete len:344 (-) Transcript_5639:120-1151(-)
MPRASWMSRNGRPASPPRHPRAWRWAARPHPPLPPLPRPAQASPIPQSRPAFQRRRPRAWRSAAKPPPPPLPPRPAQASRSPQTQSAFQRRRPQAWRPEATAATAARRPPPLPPRPARPSRSPQSRPGSPRRRPRAWRLAATAARRPQSLLPAAACAARTASRPSCRASRDPHGWTSANDSTTSTACASDKTPSTSCNAMPCRWTSRCGRPSGAIASCKSCNRVCNRGKTSRGPSSCSPAAASWSWRAAPRTSTIWRLSGGWSSPTMRPTCAPTTGSRPSTPRATRGAGHATMRGKRRATSPCPRQLAARQRPRKQKTRRARAGSTATNPRCMAGATAEAARS